MFNLLYLLLDMITLLTNFSAQTVAVERALGDKIITSSMSAKIVEVEHALGNNEITRSMSLQKAGYSAMGEQADEANRVFCKEKITRTK